MNKLAGTLGIDHLSTSQVSRMAATLDEHVAQFRHRPLNETGPYTFVSADALTMKVREGGRVINAVIMHATGVNNDGHREVLGMRVATSETGAAWRLCHQMGVFSAISHPRLVRVVRERQCMMIFSSVISMPTRSMLRGRADMTEHWSAGGKVYLCAIKDLCSKRIVGYASGSADAFESRSPALEDAMCKRGYPEGVIVHSDRASQFRSPRYRAGLRVYGARGSMGRVARWGGWARVGITRPWNRFSRFSIGSTLLVESR